MKKIKVTRGIQIILLTLLVIIISAIIVGITTNDKVAAATKKCPNYLDPPDNTVPCGGTWVIIGHSGTKHTWECSGCGAMPTESCVDSQGDNYCDWCGYKMSSGGGGDGCSHSSTRYVYKKKDDELHKQYFKCNDCGEEWYDCDLIHNFSYSSNGSSGHSIECSQCGYVQGTEAHRGATHADGRCTVCGEQYQYHSQSGTISRYNQTTTGHKPVYTCTQAGCTATYEGTEEAHTGATHPEGKCTVCQAVYQTHSQSETIKEYKKTATGHTPVYECTHEGCTSTYDGTEEAHTGATHPEGKCTVCQKVYETHEKSETIKEYKKTATGHTPVYECTHEGCTETFDGTEEPHTGATHPEGKCTVCQKVYETHEKSETIKEYKKTATGHTPVYECTHEGCTETFDGTEEPHTGATHPEGKCTVCQKVYETHEKSETVKEYIKTETGHKPIYECTHEGCTETFEGQEQPHDFENGGCTICGKEDNQELTITSEKYEIKDNYISKVQPETTAIQFKANIETNATEIKIYNKDNQLVNDDANVGTGMKVQFKLGDKTKEFTIIVSGDIDGDGNAEMSDMSIVNRYRLGKKDLEEIYIRAADVTGDGEVDFKDLTKLNRYRLSKITEL